MNSNVILFAIHFERINRKVRRNLGRRVNQNVVIREFPLRLIGTVHPAVYDAPTLWWFDLQKHRMRFVPDNIHEDRSTIEGCVLFVQLRERTRKIIAKNLVSEIKRGRLRKTYSPCLVIDS